MSEVQPGLAIRAPWIEPVVVSGAAGRWDHSQAPRVPQQQHLDRQADPPEGHL